MHHTQITARERLMPRASSFAIRSRLARLGGLTLAVLASVLGLAAIAVPAAAQAHTTQYHFQTLDNNHDPTFNQLLGINRSGLIAGYFGSGAQGHPNQGYLLSPRYTQHNYLSENYPGSTQTQVTGLNDHGVTVGFWSDMNTASQVNDNFGFYAINGRRFHTVNFPTSNNSTPPVNQLLGVNDSDVAVGFYTDANGNNHGYAYNIWWNRFRVITVPGATSVTAAAINNRNDIAGFETDAAGNVHGFLLRRDRAPMILNYPGATSTQATGVNDSDEVVGVYTDGTGNSATMHGFTWTRSGGFRTVDAPGGVGTTTINGVNDEGQLVGFYVDGAGNTDGLLATPLAHSRR